MSIGPKYSKNTHKHCLIHHKHIKQPRQDALTLAENYRGHLKLIKYKKKKKSVTCLKSKSYISSPASWGESATRFFLPLLFIDKREDK